MLKALKIKNYALIDELDIRLDKGLSIITGETGAGKSILLGALGLLQGKRADSKALYDLTQKCVVEGVFNLEGEKLRSFFDKNDLDYDPETYVRREISAKGKSRAFINDTPVNLAQLSEFSEFLLDIHSQHQTLSIKNGHFQRAVLDVCAGQVEPVAVYHEAYLMYQVDKTRLQELEHRRWELQKDQDYRSYLLKELDEIDPKVGELATLESQHDLVQNGSEIGEVARILSDELLVVDNNVSDRLATMAKQLQRIQDKVDRGQELVAKLNQLSLDVADVGQTMESLGNQNEIAPEEVDRIVERLDQIQGLLNKHRVNDENALMNVWQELGRAQSTGENLEQDIDSLKERINQQESELYLQAQELSRSRAKVVPEVQTRIEELLHEMGMPAAVIDIRLELSDQVGPYGLDQTTYLFSANKGKEPMPLDKVASGGELSRLMLSIRSLVSQNVSLPTMIFDEIDTGVSGEMADKMGKVMKDMSKHMQVISITHLPQIAARANAHYKVYKSDAGERTTSHIVVLSDDDRVEELAKMLSGAELTQAAKENARALLELT